FPYTTLFRSRGGVGPGQVDAWALLVNFRQLCPESDSVATTGVVNVLRGYCSTSHESERRSCSPDDKKSHTPSTPGAEGESSFGARTGTVPRSGRTHQPSCLGVPLSRSPLGR